jgi:hypothetical protein
VSEGRWPASWHADTRPQGRPLPFDFLDDRLPPEARLQAGVLALRALVGWSEP